MDDNGKTHTNVVGLRHDFRSQSVVPADFQSSQRKRKEKEEKREERAAEYACVG